MFYDTGIIIPLNSKSILIPCILLICTIVKVFLYNFQLSFYQKKKGTIYPLYLRHGWQNLTHKCILVNITAYSTIL